MEETAMQSHLDSSLTPKKRRELQQLQALCSRLGMPVRACTSSENPDWLIELDQGGTMAKIGVEVTELTGDRRLLDAWRRVRESLRANAKARSELQDITGLVFEVDGRLPTKHKCSALACELAEFATAHTPKSGDEADINEPFGAGYPLMNQYVQRVVLWKKGYPCSTWQCAYLATGWVGLSVPSLEKAINDKARKAGNYRADGLDELWLLVVSGAEAEDIQDGSGPDWDERVGEILKRLNVSPAPFHRVFLFDMSWNWACQVRPSVQRLVGAPKPPDVRSDADARRAP